MAWSSWLASSCSCCPLFPELQYTSSRAWWLGLIGLRGIELEWLTTCGRSEILIGVRVLLWLINWSLTTVMDLGHYDWKFLLIPDATNKQPFVLRETCRTPTAVRAFLRVLITHLDCCLVGSWVHFLDVWILYIIFVPFWPILEEYMANIFLIDSFFLRFWDSMQLPQINSWLRASSWVRFSPPCWSTWLAPGSLASERESSKVLQSLSGANAPSDPGLSAFLLQMLWIVDIDWILADRYI